MLAYSFESAALTTADLHRLEAFHSQSLRKIQRIKSTFYTKVLTDNPRAQTTCNQGVRALADQPSHATSTGHSLGCLVTF